MSCKKTVVIALALCLSSLPANGQHKNRKTTRHTPNVNSLGICSLGLAEAPKLRGFRLGMPLDEVKRKFPAAQFTLASAVEVFKFSTSDSEIPVRTLPEDESILSKPIFAHTVFAKDDVAKALDFNGIDEVEIYFTGNSLTQIRVYYSDPQWWRDHDEFRDTVVEKLALPENGKYGGGGRNQTLRDNTESYEIFTYYACRGFQAQIITGYPPVLGKKKNPFYALVLLTDEDAEMTEVDRQYEAKKAEQRRLKEKGEKERAKQRDTFKP